MYTLFELFYVYKKVALTSYTYCASVAVVVYKTVYKVMAEQKILSFRASDEVLNWINNRAEKGETPSKALQRILNEFAAEDAVNDAVNTRVNERVNEITQAPRLISVDAVNEIVDARIQAKLDQVKADLRTELLGECVA